MASFAMEEFLGDGVLIELIPRFIAAGWDDVPTLKMANLEDMELLKLTQEQKDALELRTHLHDRSLMQYANRMEASRVTLPKLLSMTTASLSSQFGMKRGHAARFVTRENSFRDYVRNSRASSTRNKNMSFASTDNSTVNNSAEEGSFHTLKSHLKLNPNFDPPTTKAVLDLKLNEGHVFKGIIASNSAYPRLWGCIQPPPVAGDVAPLSSVSNISVQKLAPEYKAGVELMMETKVLFVKGSDLWKINPTVLLCIRRPGCIMCRAEAHQLYSRKPIFDALGFQLVAVLHEQIESEVKEFWPRYWGGLVVLDQTMGFFKALGGGKLLKEKFFTGYVLNSIAKANYKAAKSTEFEHNFRGEGEIKGGLFIIMSGKGGIAYQFIERNFGDWAPIAEVVGICTKIQNESESHEC